MTTAALIFAVLLAVFTHEYAHYRAMKTDGIPVVAAGLGLPWQPMLKVDYRGVKWTLSPWLVGAYVQPSTADYERMETETTYKNIAWHYGAGVWANFLLAASAMACASIASPLTALLWAAAAAALWFFRRGFTAYVQPALAPLVLAYIAWSLARIWAAGETGLGFAGAGGLAPAELTVNAVLTTVALLSYLIGVSNLLPFWPMDNGRTVSHLLHRWFGEKANTAFRLTGVTIVLAMIAGAIGSDLWAIFT